MPRARRGRLSSIDLLPDRALPHVRDALEDLKKRDRTQDDIREELNNHLLSLGVNPVSKSAFNRKALHIAAIGEQLLRAREIAAIMAKKLDEVPNDDVGMLLSETIKSLIYDVVMEQSLSDDSASIDMLRKSADAIMKLERARKDSVETQSRMMRDFANKADEAVTKASKQAGLTKDQVAQIRREVLGVVKK